MDDHTTTELLAAATVVSLLGPLVVLVLAAPGVAAGVLVGVALGRQHRLTDRGFFSPPSVVSAWLRQPWVRGTT